MFLGLVVHYLVLHEFLLFAELIYFLRNFTLLGLVFWLMSGICLTLLGSSYGLNYTTTTTTTYYILLLLHETAFILYMYLFICMLSYEVEEFVVQQLQCLSLIPGLISRLQPAGRSSVHAVNRY